MIARAEAHQADAPLRRPWVLAVALAAIGIGLAVWLRQGGTVGARPELLFVLPASIAACGLVFGRAATKRGEERSGWLAAPVAALVAALAIALDHAFVPIGMSVQWMTLTFGDQRLLANPLLSLGWSVPLCLLAGLAWEWTLRRRLQDPLDVRTPRGAFVLAVACGWSLSAPAIAGTDMGPPGAYYAGTLTAALALEVSLTAAYAATRALWLTSAWRGVQLLVAIIGLHDWYAPVFPLANYTEADGRMYALRAGTGLAAAGVVAAWASLRARSR